jgi:hypothetical protein
MKAIRIIGGLLLSGCASVGFACQVPALMEVPTTDAIKENVQSFYTQWVAYRDGMQAFLTCTQQSLVAAGGDNAPALLKAALVRRNNAAVQEYTAVAKLYDERVLPLVKPSPGAAVPAVDLPLELDLTLPGQQ